MTYLSKSRWIKKFNVPPVASWAVVFTWLKVFHNYNECYGETNSQIWSVQNKRGGGERLKVHGGRAQAWDRGLFLSQEGLSHVKYSSRGGRVKCFGSSEMASKLLCVSAVLIVLSALRGNCEEEEEEKTRSWKSWWIISAFKVILSIFTRGRNPAVCNGVKL